MEPSSTMVICSFATTWPTLSVRNERLFTISSASDACPMTSWASRPDITGSVMQVMRPDGGLMASSMITASLAAAEPISFSSLFLSTSIPPVPSMNSWNISLLPASAATVEATRRRRTSSQSRSAPSELTRAVLLTSST